ncbi:hypothetical protein F4861DRAFT_534441 [Xylaria intraflava]|nr:hypothetical protein F4861DRAFT_534441 [Xylaria intraflava]
MPFLWPSGRDHDRDRVRDRDRYEIDSNDKTKDTKSKTDFTVMDLFRSRTVHHSSASGAKPPRHHHKSSGNAVPHSVSQRSPEKSSSHEHRGRSVNRKPCRSGSAKPESAPPAPNRAVSDGTRGYFVPPYHLAEHFAQSHRRSNPTRPLPTTRRQRSDDPAGVIVGFYNCEHLNFGREYLTSPDIHRLLSASIAFLGECQLNDTPQALLPKCPNSGYRGLSLEGEHGYHLHFPDCCGARPFSRTISVDWERVKRVHARESPGTVLLVAVGLGKPGMQCC